MKITVHRGSHEIGGTCIELATDATRLLLDLGEPLSNDSRKIDPAGLGADAVLISHPHQDHYGQIGKLSPETPVYMGRLGQSLIEATNVFLGRPALENEIRHFSRDVPFHIGDFRVTPYLVDHSAVDAYAFLIEADGKRIFYTGDFRGHGRKKVLLERLIENPPADIDLLFMEGTMMRRDNDEFPTEESVEKRIRQIIRTQENMSFLIASSQNIDRIVSAYRACRSTGKTLVVDIYTAWVLELMHQVTRNVPDMSWENIGIYASHRQNETLKAKRDYFDSFARRVWDHRITSEMMAVHAQNYLFYGKMSHSRLIEKFKTSGPVNVIYSQWLGYLTQANSGYFGAEEMAAFQNDPQVLFTYAHTSGHAVVEDLQALSAALTPRKLVPIHTEFSEEYVKKFQNVVTINDGCQFVV